MTPLEDLITPERVARATGSTLQHAELYTPFLLGACKAFDINTPLRVAGFLSQIGHESQGLAVLEENLNYSVDALLKMFGRHRISEADAHRYGRTPTQRADQEGIANCIYGGAWGAENLGNVNPGDGWRHRGRGLKQLTGLDNYYCCGKALGEDFVANPSRLLLPVNAALSAAWFWHTKGLNELADRGDVVSMTKRINGGVNGLAERQTLYALATAQDTLA